MTTETKYTPGPWFIDSDGDGKQHAVVTSTHDSTGLDDDVCEVYGGNDDDDAIRAANARLIAAAPALLEALQELLTYLGDWDDPTHETCVKARAAIARATK